MLYFTLEKSGTEGWWLLVGKSSRDSGTFGVGLVVIVVTKLVGVSSWLSVFFE